MQKARKKWLLALWLALAMSGCTTSGHNFDATALSMLTPGLSTLDESIRTFGALPEQVYPQRDGTMLALWQFKASFLTDGFYSRKLILLQYGADGRLLRLRDSTNILLEPWERQKLLGAMAPTPMTDTSTLFVLPLQDGPGVSVMPVGSSTQ